MTTTADAARLLALASAYDGRKPDDARIHAWADALNDLDPNLCADAIRRHYRHSIDFVMPAHIRQLVRQLRDERADRGAWKALQPAPENCVPMPPEIKAQIIEIANRRKLPPDVESEAPPTTETA
jgi:hypothetical protein